jgi:hypothetical protein
MLEAKPITSPMAASFVLSAFTGDPMEDSSLYRSTIESLQYLALTHPDLGFAINRVCQFMHRPTKLHRQAIKKILHYLKHTVSHGLLLYQTQSTSLQAYSNADWAGCLDGKRSTRAYCVFLGSNLISWSSRKQPTTSCSYKEAEYKAVANTTVELLWIQALLHEQGISLPSPPKLWCDSIGATYMSVNLVFYVRTKHGKINFHFVRDRFANKSLEILFIPSSDQLADVLTKPLVSTWFQRLCFKLNARSLPLTLQEGINAHDLLSKNSITQDTSHPIHESSDKEIRA